MMFVRIAGRSGVFVPRGPCVAMVVSRGLMVGSRGGNTRDEYSDEGQACKHRHQSLESKRKGT
jgi:hypothetical protein